MFLLIQNGLVELGLWFCGLWAGYLMGSWIVCANFGRRLKEPIKEDCKGAYASGKMFGNI
jgi:hypothetical protein